MLHRPLWTEGTLLCPQHLQQQDLYHEQLLALRLQVVAAHPWGVMQVRLDPAALQAGQVALTHLRAVLPDGSVVEIDESTPNRPATRAISPCFPAHGERVTVYLAVATVRPGATHCASEPSPQHRYRTITRAIFDLTVHRSSRDIELGELHLGLRLGDESHDDFVTLPIASIQRDTNGSFIVDPTFIPPIVHLAGAPALVAELQQLVAAIDSRRRSLADDRRRQHDLPRALFYHTLSGALPLLRHLVETPETSPSLLYQHLLRILGELRSLGSSTTHEVIGYDHRQLHRSMWPLVAELRQHVRDTLPDDYIRIPLEARSDGLWIGELLDDRLQRCSSFVLAVETDHDPAHLANELPSVTRIAAWRRISLIVRNNVLGAPMQHMVHPPVELPVLPHHSYFGIHAEDPSWLEVLRERNVAVYLPHPYDPEHARISLMAVPHRAA